MCLFVIFCSTQLGQWCSEIEMAELLQCLCLTAFLFINLKEKKRENARVIRE